jgi:hypothetical protein
MAMAVACRHVPKMDERNNKQVQALVHRKQGGTKVGGIHKTGYQREESYT